MPTVVACPECDSKLNVPDGLAGRAVRCVRCGATFTAPEVVSGTPATPAPQAPPQRQLSVPVPPSAPAPQPPPPGPSEDLALRLKLSLDDDAPPARPSRADDDDVELEPLAARRPAALNDEHEDLRACPNCGKQVHRDYVRCPFCGQRLVSSRGRPRSSRRRVRMDAPPHRGGMILTFGILGIVGVFLCAPFGTPFGLIFGILAWVLGHSDLNKMNAGEMDPEGEGNTRSGWICGIIATCLGLFILLGCGSFWFISLMARPGY
jgi:predicted Zn finger-like uncharacterized protein